MKAMRRRTKRRGRAIIAALLLSLLAVGGCAPRGRAVGDPQESTIAHDHIDHADYSVALVGSGTDDELTQRFRKGVENSIVAVMYAQAANGEQQRKAVEDFAQRKVGFIALHPDDPDDAPDEWRTALGAAREAGVPVILLDGHITPDDTLLYAADFTPTDDMPGEGVYSVMDALSTVLDAEDHGKTMRVHY